MKRQLLFTILLTMGIFVSCRKVDGLPKKPVLPSTDKVFEFFAQMNEIYRPSGGEVAATEFIKKFAVDRKLAYKVDEVGNVVIMKPATVGFEHAPTVAFQSHLDMVYAVEDGKTVDFKTTPIQTYVENGWLKARGTSMGADDGIGVAISLAILDDKSICHPRLECIFTVDEEVGMTGAGNLKPGFFSAKYLMSLDAEEVDKVCIGSAGMKLHEVTLDFTPEASPVGYTFQRIEIDGLLGGHSGLMIDKNRVNASRLTAEFLQEYLADKPLVIASFSGGFAGNIIPPSSTCVVGIPTVDKTYFADALANYRTKKKAEFATSDPGLNIRLSDVVMPSEVLCAATSKALLDLITKIPYGVIRMSGTIPGLVQTSNNLGVVAMNPASFTLLNYARSSKNDELDALIATIESTCTAVGAQYKIAGSAPVWDALAESKLLTLYRDSFEEVNGLRPTPVAYHFGLEVGYISALDPGMEIILIGPNVYDVHSVNERVEIASVESAFHAIIETLFRMKEM